MATVINNPGETTSTGDGMGFMVGAILLIAVVFLFILYGLPALRGASGGTTNINPQLNVPPANININPGTGDGGTGGGTSGSQ